MRYIDLKFTLSDIKYIRREPAKPYSKNYKECCDEALEEKRQDARPELKNYLEDISEYEVIYIGSPIYWGTMPMSMFTRA